jgi:hypothetical protein
VAYIEQGGCVISTGLVGFVEQNVSLWVFSLNHDMMIECIAQAHGLRLPPALLASVLDTAPGSERPNHRRDPDGVLARRRS